MSETRKPSAGKPIVVNGVPRWAAARTLADLVAETGEPTRKVATAVNGVFVPARERATVELSPGDKIEILAPQQGG